MLLLLPETNLCCVGDLLVVGALLLVCIALYNDHYVDMPKNFQPGRGYELHVTEKAWEHMGAKLEVVKCHNENDFGCSVWPLL